MDKSQKIMLFANVVLAGFVLSVFYHAFLINVFHAGEPFNSFLYQASAAFCDFGSVLPHIRSFEPYHMMTLWVVYFPLTYLILFPFSLMKNPIIAYLFFFPPFLMYLIYMNIKSFACETLSKLQNFQNIFIITFLSYPVLYVLDKGNFDMYLFILFGLGMYAFKNEKFVISAVLLAVANAIKPLFVFFLLLFLIKKRYKEAFLSVLLTGLMVIGGFLIFKGGFLQQIMYLLQSIIMFKGVYIFLNHENYGMAHSSSLFMLSKLIFCKSTAHPIISTVVHAKIYDFISLIISVLTVVFVWREKVFWKQLTLLTCHLLLLPCITYDYKFIFLFIPLWLFVNQKEKSKFDLAYTLIFASLFIPKSFMFLNPHITSSTVVQWFSLSMVINPIIFIALMLLIVREQYLPKEKD